MGIPMDNIHAPTVVSGPTSDPRTADEKYSKNLSLLDLIAEKDKVEAELKALGSVLDSVSSTALITLHPFVAGTLLILCVLSLAWRQYGYKPHNLRWIPPR